MSVKLYSWPSAAVVRILPVFSISFGSADNSKTHFSVFKGNSFCYLPLAKATTHFPLNSIVSPSENALRICAFMPMLNVSVEAGGALGLLLFCSISSVFTGPGHKLIKVTLWDLSSSAQSAAIRSFWIEQWLVDKITFNSLNSATHANFPNTVGRCENVSCTASRWDIDDESRILFRHQFCSLYGANVMISVKETHEKLRKSEKFGLRSPTWLTVSDIDSSISQNGFPKLLIRASTAVYALLTNMSNLPCSRSICSKSCVTCSSLLWSHATGIAFPPRLAI